MEGERVTDSLTEQLHIIIPSSMNRPEFGGELLKWIDEVARCLPPPLWKQRDNRCHR